MQTRSTQRGARRSNAGLLVLDPRLYILMMLAVLAGALAYQAPPAGAVQIGWLGDRLFFPASPGLSAEPTRRGALFADELTGDAASGRSRWTRERALLYLPGLGRGDLDLTLRIQGWPADVLNPAGQPAVLVLADGTPVSSLSPTSAWADYHLIVPDAVRRGAGLTIELRASDVFTGTRSQGTAVDVRPKGVRIERLVVNAAPASGPLVRAVSWGTLGLLAACAGLGYALLARLLRYRTAAFVLVALAVGAGALGLAFARVWLAAALWPLAGLLGALLLVAWLGPILRYLVRLVQQYGRGDALGYGLLVAALLWLAGVAARVAGWLQLPGMKMALADAVLYGALGAGLVALILVYGRRGLPRVTHWLVAAMRSPRGGMALLLLLGGVWLGYQALVIRDMPHVGHADYADNAVVARSLLEGRGWTVDYVTQFIRLYDGVTRPQETWPLLQPVWILPFFALFGPETWAAKLPNLVFNGLLVLVTYGIGTRLADRRVGLAAAVLTLTNYLFFRLTIYPTHDLAKVVFSMAAVWAAYRVVRDHAPVWAWALAGLPAGLMMLQKPSGALIGLGIAVWMLVGLWRYMHAAPAETLAAQPAPAAWQARLVVWLRGPGLAIASRMLAWGLTSSLVLSPYLVRNQVLFGTPVYSTERYDAWTLEYDPVWDRALYSIYTQEAGFNGLGTPAPHFLLRWGFDRTIEKLANQVLALRNYLLPAIPNLPEPVLLAGRADKQLLWATGAWLALAGLLVLARRHRALIGLLALAFGPYALFMTVYWHTNEERYWVILVPWLAILVGTAAWGAYDRLAALHGGRWSPLALAAVLTALVAVVSPSWPDIVDKVEQEPRLWAADLDVYRWLNNERHTAPDAVMMSRTPWQLSWHADRPALMIPYTTDPQVFLRIAHYYGVDYLVLESVNRPERPVQQMIDALLDDRSSGFELVYTTAEYPANCDRGPCLLRSEVYRFPPPERAAAAEGSGR